MRRWYTKYNWGTGKWDIIRPKPRLINPYIKYDSNGNKR